LRSLTRSTWVALVKSLAIRSSSLARVLTGTTRGRRLSMELELEDGE
jgi:hypothetical protein